MQRVPLYLSLVFGVLLTGCCTEKSTFEDPPVVYVTPLESESTSLPADVPQAVILVVDVHSESKGRVVLAKYDSLSKRLKPMVYLMSQPQEVDRCVKIVQAFALKPPAVTGVMFYPPGYEEFSSAFKSKMAAASVRIAWLNDKELPLWTSYLMIY